jgi:hypothetical protein
LYINANLFHIPLTNKMSAYYYLSTLLLAATIFTCVNSQNALHEYVVRKDFFSNLKSGEFSVYDKSEKNLQFRIESEYSVMHNIKVIDQATKQEIGRLSSQVNLLQYTAEFSTLDTNTNKWINGVIRKNIQIVGTSYNIDWNNQRITMETEPISLTTKFFDSDKQLLAQYRTRVTSLITKKYDLQVFSNAYPEQIYFLALAARNHASKKRSFTY